MAAASFDVWSRDPAGAQPYRSATGLVTTWDGRIDNRGDLERRFADAEATDVALATHVYERSCALPQSKGTPSL
jgi:hypothetical protein